VAKEREDRGLGKRFFVLLLGLAGLGVGVWLFRHRKDRHSS